MFNQFYKQSFALPEPNIMIGNVYNTTGFQRPNIQSAQELANFIGVDILNIKNFRHNGKDISAYIKVNYSIRFVEDRISYFFDLENKCDYYANLQSLERTLINYAPSANVESQVKGGYNELQFKHDVMVHFNRFGNSISNDNTFKDYPEAILSELYADKVLQTINSGNLEGDLQDYLSKQGNIIFKDLSNVSQNTSPQEVNNLTTVDIRANYAILNFTNPVSTNNLKYVLIFLNQFFQNYYHINDSNFYVTNLSPNTFYEVKIMLADEFFNLSNYSNKIEFTTTSLLNYTILANEINSGNIKITENYISPIENKTVDVYVDGVLNNTITNANKYNIFATGLNENTNYDIYLIIEGNQSNTINVTTLNFLITLNSISSTVILLNQNYFSSIENKTVDVYVDGVLNNTITNAKYDQVYAENLSENTNYDIYLKIGTTNSNTLNLNTITSVNAFSDLPSSTNWSRPQGHTGDKFTSSPNDFDTNSITFEFKNLIVPKNPIGVLLESGAYGTGMAISFSKEILVMAAGNGSDRSNTTDQVFNSIFYDSFKNKLVDIYFSIRPESVAKLKIWVFEANTNNLIISRENTTKNNLSIGSWTGYDILGVGTVGSNIRNGLNGSNYNGIMINGAKAYNNYLPSIF